MSGDDDQDGSDWLSSHFDATGQVPAQTPVAQTPVAPAPVAPAPATPPAVTPPPANVAPPSVPSASSEAKPFPFATNAPAPAPVVVTPPVNPGAPISPQPAAVVPPVTQPAAPEVSVPLPSAPEPNAGGGFNWGLKPGGSVAEPPAAAPLVEPPVSAPPIVEPRAESPVASAPVVPVIPPTPTVVAPVGPPPLVEPPQTPAAQSVVDEPTKPLSWSEFAAAQEQSPVDQPTEAYTVQPWLPAEASAVVSDEHPVEPAESGEPTSAIDSLFGDHKFQEYEEVGVLTTLQSPPAAAASTEPAYVEPREPLSRTQKILMGVAGGLIAALILVGLFFFGQHLGAAAAITPTPAKTHGAATPTPAGTGGPAGPGIQQWTALQGGECIQPFSTAWAITFTVVSCTADHDAEMVFKGALPDAQDAKYPSVSAFQKELTPLCSASTAINYAAAASVTDLQVSFSYPPNTAMWLKGDRAYYCFVDRVSGGNLPGDLAVPKTK